MNETIFIILFNLAIETYDFRLIWYKGRLLWWHENIFVD